MTKLLLIAALQLVHYLVKFKMQSYLGLQIKNFFAFGVGSNEIRFIKLSH